MSRRPCMFRQTDLKRALEGALAAGIDVARIEISPDGLIVVVPGKPADEVSSGELDKWTNAHARKTKGN